MLRRQLTSVARQLNRSNNDHSNLAGLLHVTQNSQPQDDKPSTSSSHVAFHSLSQPASEQTAVTASTSGRFLQFQSSYSTSSSSSTSMPSPLYYQQQQNSQSHSNIHSIHPPTKAPPTTTNRRSIAQQATSSSAHLAEQQLSHDSLHATNGTRVQIPTPDPARPDPFALVREEIESVTERVRRCIVSDIPVLERAAEYFFRKGREGKRLRSTVLLLLASSFAATPATASILTVDETPASYHHPDPRRRQQRIAEITELIHVASLLHDDVIDEADTRRGLKALNTLFGNKIAILAGDFLLARASVSLAALRNSEVIALMSQVLENLVAGEILQMNATREEVTSMDYYLRKTFYKTASLLANSCKSIAVIAECDEDATAAAWEYGHHLGLAFQLVDDVLDFTGSSEEMGKPGLNDVKSGLATAPVLFAAEQFPELLPVIQRRFNTEGDIARTLELVAQSDGIERAKELASSHAEQAAAALLRLPVGGSEDAVRNRKALEDVLWRVLNRKK